jgi:hypothetical protein
VAGGAQTPQLAGKGDQEVVATRRAVGPRHAVGEPVRESSLLRLIPPRTNPSMQASSMPAQRQLRPPEGHPHSWIHSRAALATRPRRGWGRWFHDDRLTPPVPASMVHEPRSCTRQPITEWVTLREQTWANPRERRRACNATPAQRDHPGGCGPHRSPLRRPWRWGWTCRGSPQVIDRDQAGRKSSRRGCSARSTRGQDFLPEDPPKGLLVEGPGLG